MTNIKDMFEHFATNPYITCSSQKCGQCAKEKIKSLVCLEMIDTGKNQTSEDLSEMENRVQTLWKKHPIYIKIQEFLNLGMSLKEATDKMIELGYEP